MLYEWYCDTAEGRFGPFTAKQVKRTAPADHVIDG
jgi:hypothetical protein